MCFPGTVHHHPIHDIIIMHAFIQNGVEGRHQLPTPAFSMPWISSASGSGGSQQQAAAGGSQPRYRPSGSISSSIQGCSLNDSTRQIVAFPIGNVNLRQAVTPGCLLSADWFNPFSQVPRAVSWLRDPKTTRGQQVSDFSNPCAKNCFWLARKKL